MNELQKIIWKIQSNLLKSMCLSCYRSISAERSQNIL